MSKTNNSKTNYWIVLAMFIVLGFLCYVQTSFAYTIDGNTIIYEGSYGKVTQNPHTLTKVENYPEINFTSYFTGSISLDIAFGFDEPDAVPSAAWYRNPHYEDVEHSYKCDYFFNYTTSPKHFYCYKWDGNITDYILIYDHAFDSGDPITQTAYWTENELIEWTDISDKFDQINYNFDGKNTWYIVEDVTFDNMETKTLKAKIDILPRSEGKYDIMIKRNQDSWAEAISSGNYVLLDPYWNTTNYTYTRTGNTSKTANSYWRGIEIQPFEDLRVVQLCGESNIGITNASVSNNNTTCYATSMANGCAEMNCNVTENHTYYAMIDSDFFYFYPPTFPYPIETDYFNITCDAQGADEQDPPYVCYNGGENWMNVRNITTQNLINMDPSNTQLWLNGSESNLAGTYGITLNASALVDVTGINVELYRNGSLLDNSTTYAEDVDIIGAGYWNYTAYAIGNATVTPSSQEYFANISKAAPSCSLIISPTSPTSYGNSTTATCACGGGGTVKLYRNSTDITAQNATPIILGAGGYSFVCNTTETANYTSATNSSSYTVNKAVPDVQINFNTSDSVPTSTVVNVSCNVSGGLSGSMFYDLGAMANPSYFNTSTPTVWNFTCNNTATANYTTGNDSRSLTYFLAGGFQILQVLDEKYLTPLTFNVTIYNSTFSVTETNITSYNNNTVKGDLTIAISATNYVPRNYYIYVPYNSSYNMTGYLLGDADGVYVTYWSYSNENPTGEALSYHQFKRFLNSSYVVVTESTADLEGKGTVFLDPYTNYVINSETSDGLLTKNISSYNPNPSFILRIDFNGTLGNNVTWLFGNTTYSLTPTDVYLRYSNTSNVTQFNYTIVTNNDSEFFYLRLLYNNGTELYLSNSTNATGGEILVNLNYTLLSGTVYAETYFKRANYSLASWNRTYIITAQASGAIPDALNYAVNSSGLPVIVLSLIAVFGSFGISMIANRAVRTGSGIVYLGVLTIFAYFGLFGNDPTVTWRIMIGLYLIEAGIIMYREIY